MRFYIPCTIAPVFRYRSVLLCTPEIGKPAVPTYQATRPQPHINLVILHSYPSITPLVEKAYATRLIFGHTSSHERPSFALHGIGSQVGSRWELALPDAIAIGTPRLWWRVSLTSRNRDGV